MNTRSTVAVAPGRGITFASWTLRILAAVAFLTAGSAKLAAAPMMVAVFDQIGIGQWFRVVTGVLEVAGALALLIRPTAGLAGLMLSVTMAFGVLTHLLLIGGSPVPALALLLITAAVAWLERQRIAHTLRPLRRVWA